jgi:hypothetical protein
MPETYTTAAAKGFARLVGLYETYNTPYHSPTNGETSLLFDGNFWFGGNALHTMLDYLIDRRLEDKPILDMGLAVYKKYSSEFGGSQWWRDDYAWWGNAFLQVLNHRDALGYGNPSYSQLMNQLVVHTHWCWKELTGSWYSGAYGERDNAASGADVTGGVFNIPYDDETTPPGNPPMKGRNSVTNEGYWLLSQGLAKFPRNPGDPDFSGKAADMQKWFGKWLSDKYRPGLRDPRGLVPERPMGNAANTEWCWTGDQGLLFRALTNAGEDDTAREIAHAAFKNLSAPDQKGRDILHEHLGASFSGFEVDYATGKGIFVRNLVDAGVKPSNCPYAQDIKQNAAAVWRNRLDTTTNQFSYNWAGATSPEPLQLIERLTGKIQPLCNLVMQASGLDALNAAMLIAPSEEIPSS